MRAKVNLSSPSLIPSSETMNSSYVYVKKKHTFAVMCIPNAHFFFEKD